MANKHYQKNINSKSKPMLKKIKKHPQFVYTTPMYNEFYILSN